VHSKSADKTAADKLVAVNMSADKSAAYNKTAADKKSAADDKSARQEVGGRRQNQRKTSRRTTSR
jgi:hypothetical protein